MHHLLRQPILKMALVAGLVLPTVAVAARESEGFMPWDASSNVVLNGSAQKFKEAAPVTLTGSATKTARKKPGIVGLDLTIRASRYPVIRAVFQGSPAYYSGLLPGDAVLAVDGETTLSRGIQEVDDMISDIPGTPVRFTVYRQGGLREAKVIVAPISQVSKQVQAQYSAGN